MRQARSGRFLWVCAWAGIIAPFSFATLVVVQSVLQPDYSQVRLPISVLAAWPYGWIQNLNFFLYALLLALFAAGLHVAIRPAPFGILGPACLTLTSVGAAIAGFYPWTIENGVLSEPPGHVVGAITHFLSLSIGLIVLSRRIARDPAWQPLGVHALASGVSLLVMFFGFAFYVIDDGAPLHEWAGLAQRVIVLIWMASVFTLARRLRRIAISLPDKEDKTEKQKEVRAASAAIP